MGNFRKDEFLTKDEVWRTWLPANTTVYPHELCGITDKSTTTFCEKDAAQVFFLAEALTVSPVTLSTVTRTVKSFLKSLRLVGRDDDVPVGGVIEEAETVRLKWE
jgi:hypothetical protein